MNVQSVKTLIESYGKLDTLPCWEIVNNNSRDKKYVWIIQQPFTPFRPGNISKHINFKNEFSIHFTGTYNPHPTQHRLMVNGYLASFEFRTDTPMSGIISKITLVQRKRPTNETIETVSSESDWINCKSGSKYSYLSSEQWKFEPTLYSIPKFSLNVPDRIEINYKQCIIVIIEFINVQNNDITLAISEEQKREHVAKLNCKVYDSKDYADVALVVKHLNGEEETTLMAHKAILAAGSSVFKAMMDTNMVEKKSSVIEIVDFEPEIVEEMLKHIYTGEANLVDHAEHLLRCADKYDLQGLMDLCQMYFAKNISTVGFVKIFEILQLYEERVPILKKFTVEYFKMNENSLIESHEFQDAVQMYPKEFADLYISKKRKREED